MPMMYFESDSLKELSAKEFMKRYWRVNDLSSKLNKKSINLETVLQIRTMQELYETEFNRRIEEEIMDEEEADDLYEYFEEKYSKEPYIG